ncbi:hypothetical protein D1816_23885 [Aquimarina sp. AD10]|uniref:Four helix bundle protein n=1 Tax=Aquimarina aggregata TaxID=1642818 RepID=A0A163ABD6_9FLAO|nr:MULTISPECIES: hypothetical protein [Aquimarina]AXT63257.1 hypothetical protein D1816_23885 [Aquimarina sp. AD10]KZS40413.1 hypothetical protein AWE51_05530 [Aquimarina aggregata]RKN00730.1 hypothetical protein D7033_07810 [Aquimarina sp. AD10]
MRPQPKNKRLYKKAREILTLSRSISNYLVYDMASLQNNGTEHPHIYFTGDIIRQSDELVPKIISAESQTFQDDRIKHANSLIHITNRLYKNCERLEQSDSNGKEFLILLRKELRKFRHLQRRWLLSL